MVKLEIILDASWTTRLLETLDTIGVQGYTVFETAEGKGKKGAVSPAGFSDVFDQKYVMAIVDEKEALNIVEKIKPVLTNAKGVVFSTSQVQWLFPTK